MPNRISFSAHLTSFAEDCLPSERHAYYYAARARGGTGLIITEEQSVHPTDRAYEKLIEAFRPEVVAGLQKDHQGGPCIRDADFRPDQPQRPAVQRRPVEAARMGPVADSRPYIQGSPQRDGDRGHRRGHPILLELGRPRAGRRVRRRRASVRPQLPCEAVHVFPYEPPLRRLRGDLRERACAFPSSFIAR